MSGYPLVSPDFPHSIVCTQSCLTLCDPMNCSLPGSSVHGIFQAIILEWVTIPFSRGSSQPRDRTQVSCIAGRFFTTEFPGKPASTHCDQPCPKRLSCYPPPPEIHTFTTTSGWCYCQSPDPVDSCQASSPLAFPWPPVQPLTFLHFLLKHLFVCLCQVSAAARRIFVASCEIFRYSVWSL